mgnify:CR=1 FL=1
MTGNMYSIRDVTAARQRGDCLPTGADTAAGMRRLIGTWPVSSDLSQKNPLFFLSREQQHDPTVGTDHRRKR